LYNELLFFLRLSKKVYLYATSFICNQFRKRNSFIKQPLFIEIGWAFTIPPLLPTLSNFSEFISGLKTGSIFQLKFKNRENAANVLAAALQDSFKKYNIKKGGEEPILVLGIARGGVIVADIVARKVSPDAEFDIVIPRKIAAPHNEELGIGAVMEDGTSYFHEDLIKSLEITKEYLDKEIAKQKEGIKHRKTLYYKKSKSKQESNKNNDDDNNNKKHKNKRVILIDDGIASGATAIAAARWVRNHLQPKHLIIAAPVCPKETVNLLKKEVVVDGVEVVSAPSAYFSYVGQYYKEFNPVDDNQVMEIMRRWNLL
jgi:putative phosphoribosyl transferase